MMKRSLSAVTAAAASSGASGLRATSAATSAPKKKPKREIAKDWDATIQTPFGVFGIKTNVTEIIETAFLPHNHKLVSPAGNPVAEACISQVNSYLNDPAFVFHLPLSAVGTVHQRAVWKQMTLIPPGTAETYGAVAKKIGSAPRAVGGACRSNPYCLVVPCHRIVAATGIGGFSGRDEEGFEREVKRWLLTHEGYRP